MKTIQLKTTKEEYRVIGKIATRATRICKTYGIKYNLFECSMDIIITHLNAQKIKLQELSEADEGNFMHDILGIRNHLNKQTGELRDCFLPRYSA